MTDWLPRLVVRVPVTVCQGQHDTTGQLYSVSSALLIPEERTLDATLRQLNQFGYDLDRLQFVARDEVELLGRGPRRLQPLAEGRVDGYLGFPPEPQELRARKIGHVVVNTFPRFGRQYG